MMASASLLRTLADKVNVTEAQPYEWVDVPLTNDIDAITLKAGELIEVFFDSDPPRASGLDDVVESWSHVFVDVEVQ